MAAQHERSKSFPWYDSPWLSAYLAAREFIQVRCPQKEQEFVRAFDVFRTPPDFEVLHLPGLFDDNVLAELRSIVRDLDHRNASTDELVNFGRFVKWDLPYVTTLQEDLAERVSELVGEAVEPSYNFLSLYKELGVCHVHMDAPFSKWTIDYCIEQSAVWPIYFSRIVPWPEDWVDPGPDWENIIKSEPANRFRSFEMQEGEALLFSGSSQWHYREPIERRQEQNYCHLLFLHYIPAGTADLKVPANWAEIFDIPALAELAHPTGDRVMRFDK